VPACWVGAVSELVSLVGASTCVSAFGTSSGASTLLSGVDAPRSVFEIAEVVLSVAASVDGVASRSDVGDDMPACSFGLDGLGPSDDSPSAAVAFRIATISLEDDDTASPRPGDKTELAAVGLGLGIGIPCSACAKDKSLVSKLDGNNRSVPDGRGLGNGTANPVGGKAVLVGLATCRVG
jgi:hypothetical protein